MTVIAPSACLVNWPNVRQRFTEDNGRVGSCNVRPIPRLTCGSVKVKWMADSFMSAVVWHVAESDGPAADHRKPQRGGSHGATFGPPNRTPKRTGSSTRPYHGIRARKRRSGWADSPRPPFRWSAEIRRRARRPHRRDGGADGRDPRPHSRLRQPVSARPSTRLSTGSPAIAPASRVSCRRLDAGLAAGGPRSIWTPPRSSRCWLGDYPDFMRDLVNGFWP
jgi:hypothetical protein